MLKEDEIWDAALRVWEDLPSCKIANAFVQAKRISEKIIQLNGDNVFLSGAKGGISSGIRNDFFETADGNARKDAIKLTFEEGLIGLKGRHKDALLMTNKNDEPEIGIVDTNDSITSSNDTLVVETSPQAMNGSMQINIPQQLATENNNDGIETGTNGNKNTRTNVAM